MRRLLIVGAGDFGREVLDWAMAVPAEKRDWQVGGFLDVRPDSLDGFGASQSILGDPDTFVFTDNDCFICGVGNPSIKLPCCRRLQTRGARFITLIHPAAVVGSGCRFGEGCILCPGAVVANHAALGDFVTLNLYSTVGHNATIGDGCTLSSHTDVTGWAVLGEGVFLGSHASVLPKTRVAEYTRVGAGSVVVKKTAPHTTVMGVPAQRIA